MPRNSIVVNGYSVPFGKSGVAVIRACEIVNSEPGIPQAELMRRACEFANISLSSSTWLVSPGKRSPALRLWDRKRVGRKYLCYPNEFTSLLSGAQSARFDEWMRHARARTSGDVTPQKGDLVQVKNMRIYTPWSTYNGKALFLGWTDCYDLTMDTLEEFGEKREYRTVPVPLVMVEGRILPLHLGKAKVIK